MEGTVEGNEVAGGQEEGEKFRGGQGGNEGGEMEEDRGMEREKEKERR